jgi:hydroxyethylthiazole kinase-like uncharacterized protein yjeF
MTDARPIDAAWRAAHPLPDLGDGADKDERGRVLLVGGSALVPGAVRLTGEAALRVGAGKVRIATIHGAAIGIGLVFPEAAMIGLPGDEEGEIAAGALAVLVPHLDACDALVVGPGMSDLPHTADLVEGLLRALGGTTAVLLDAGALTAMHGKATAVKALGGRAVLTPHHGELAALTGFDKAEIAHDPAGAVVGAAAALNAVIALKSADTLIADGSGSLLSYSSEAPGLGTAGSGDVLAGIIGGLLARGVDPLDATAWGVWLHGEAGKSAAAAIGPIGFLARDLPGYIPGLIAAC